MKRAAFSKGFGGRLLEAIKARGWTQREFAAKMGLTPTGINQYVGGRVPDGLTLKRGADLLGVTTDWLLSEVHRETSRGMVADAPSPYQSSETHIQPEEAIALEILHNLRQKEVERWLRIGLIFMDSEEKKSVESKIEALMILWEGEESKT